MQGLGMTMTRASLLIVGGSKGIGQDLARLAAAERMDVCVTGRRRETLETAFDRDEGIDWLAFDVTDAASIEEALSGRAFNHLVILAGSVRPGPLRMCGAGEMIMLMKERVVGPALVIKHLHHQRPLTSVVLTSGLSTVRPQAAAGGIFSAALAGVEGLTRGLAVELAPTRVNAVRLGWIISERHQAVAGGREAFYEGLSARIPVGAVGSTEAAARLYLDLLRNDYVSGQIVVCDGALSLV